jgi:hypothetical protein
LEYSIEKLYKFNFEKAWRKLPCVV